VFFFAAPQNKKQRMMVRTAVLKMKDPRQIIKDMEKLDEMGEPLQTGFKQGCAFILSSKRILLIILFSPVHICSLSVFFCARVQPCAAAAAE
jgi:hypothetical protein